MDRGAWWATVHGVIESRTQLSDFHFQLSLANHADAESFLLAHALLSQDECQRGFWKVSGHVASPFDLSHILLIGGGLLVLCSYVQDLLSQNNSCEWLLWCLAQGGQFQPLCFPYQPRNTQPSFSDLWKIHVLLKTFRSFCG